MGFLPNQEDFTGCSRRKIKIQTIVNAPIVAKPGILDTIGENHVRPVMLLVTRVIRKVT